LPQRYINGRFSFGPIAPYTALKAASSFCANKNAA
jgi:hypothetical protein